MQDCSAGSSEEKILPFGDYDVIPGTTGLPKGVTLTHISFLNLSQNMKHYVDASTESNDIEVKNFLALIPWFHAYGFITTSGVLSFRLGKVFLTRFEDKLFLETVQNYKDALILSINGALGGIELTYITVNNDIVTFTMRDSKTKTARSLVIRDEIMNISKNNPKNIVSAANTTAKSHNDVHHASSASHQQHQSLYTDPQPSSRHPPVYIEHCSPEKIKIDTHPKSSSTRSLPSTALYHYYIIIILLLSTTIIHCSQIGDWSQSALGESNSQPLFPSQWEGRASELSTSVTASSQPGSISNGQQTNIRAPRGKRAVTITGSPNMSNVNLPSNDGRGGTITVTITGSPNMSNVHFPTDDGPGGPRTVTITGSPNMSNVDFQYNGGPGGSRTVTITDCPNMSHVTFQYNDQPGVSITVTMTTCHSMSNVKFIFNAGPGSTITATLFNCPNMSRVTFIFDAAPGKTVTATLTDRPNISDETYVYN